MIPFAKPWITDDERQAVLAVLGGDILAHGPQQKAFEEEFAAMAGPGAHAVAVSSGMAALHLTYMVLGIGPGDEVIVPAQTHVATAHAVELVGARPVFADCDPRTGNITAAAIEPLISSRTRAIGLVHFLGIPCDMDQIMALAQRRGLKVVEDCALAVGTRLAGVHAGLWGDAGCFSFYPAKHIATGEGGMLLTHHAGLAAQAAAMRGFGVDRSYAQRTMPGMYDVPSLGLNYRMAEIPAALGRRQLARLDEMLRRRAENFRALAEGLAGLPNLRMLDACRGDSQNSHYCLSVVLEGSAAARRDEIVRGLRDAGIGTSVYYPHPVPRLAYYRQKYGYDAAAFPRAAAISDASIALPVGPHITPADARQIAATLGQQLGETR